MATRDNDSGTRHLTPESTETRESEQTRNEGETAESAATVEAAHEACPKPSGWTSSNRPRARCSRRKSWSAQQRRQRRDHRDATYRGPHTRTLGSSPVSEDHNNGLNPLAFALTVGMAVNANSEMRRVQADNAILRNARAIQAVQDATGQVSAEQMQTLYLAEQIEDRVDGWRTNKDALRNRALTTVLGWTVGLLLLIAVGCIPNVNAFLPWLLGIGGGVGAYRELEKLRRAYNGDHPLPAITGHHSHGGGGSHSHPHIRRHRHYGDVDGPMY